MPLERGPTPPFLATAVAALPAPVMMRAQNGAEIPATLIFDRDQAVRDVLKTVDFEALEVERNRYRDALVEFVAAVEDHITLGYDESDRVIDARAQAKAALRESKSEGTGPV
jgi:hypothetical protein